MNVQQMAAQARDHWKKTNPKIYQQMVEDKALKKVSEAAASLTISEIDALMMIGIPEQTAWQESRQLFIFRTASQLEEDYQPEHRRED